MKLAKSFLFIVVASLALSLTSYGQSSDDLFFRGYYYDYKLLNPAFTGIKDKHIITTVYTNVPSGLSSAQSFYGSYETRIPSLTSGVGALGSYHEWGATKRIRGSVFLNKQLSFNDRSGLHIGTQVFYRRVETDYSQYSYVHPDDPLLLGTENEISNAVNIDLGVLYYSSVVKVGVSVKNVIKEEGQNTILNAIATREFTIAPWLTVSPSVVFITDFEDNRVDINSTFEIKQWVLFGAGYVCVEGTDDVSFNAGVNIKDWVEVITHLYSSAHKQVYEFSDPRFEVMIRTNVPHPKARK